jgi:hypothetical protein
VVAAAATLAAAACPHLRSLHLSNCPLAQAMAAGLTALSRLTCLTVFGVEDQQLPASTSCLTALRTLSISWARKMSALPPPALAPLTGLTSLAVAACSCLTLLPHTLSCLTQLQYLHVADLPGVCALPGGLSCLLSLRRLILHACSALQQLPELTTLAQLTMLDVSQARRLAALPAWLAGLPQLQLVRARECGGLNGREETAAVVELLRRKGCVVEL